MHIKGLELARAYFEQHGKPMLRELFPAYTKRIAAGLVGQGSECFGFDDELSADHDFGPGFCLWLTADDYAAIGSELARAYAGLPQSFMGYAARPAGQRVGVFCTGDFYFQLLGSTDARFSNLEWLRMPEAALATACNGAVFDDPLGAFSAVRERLLAFYPEDVRIKKLAARAALMAQSGQYNYARSMCRGESVAAFTALAEFIRHSIALIYLLNRQYPPFYKWMHRGLLRLPILGAEVDVALSRLSMVGLCKDAWQFAPAAKMLRVLNTGDENVVLMENICGLVRQRLQTEGLTEGDEDFLLVHAERLTKHIKDPRLRSLHITDA